MLLDCSLRDSTAWRIVARPRRPPPCGAHASHRQLRRHIHFKPAPCARTLHQMRHPTTVDIQLAGACAMARLGASWLAHNGLRRVVVGVASPRTARCDAVSTSSTPVCAFPAPNQTLNLHGVVIDCCLRNDAAWRVVAGPQQPSTSGGGRRPPPYPRAAAPYLLQARPVCAYPAPNETLRLRGGANDCCLRNGAA
jgi:hypothetical protein